jgi:hypothetical protein
VATISADHDLRVLAAIVGKRHSHNAVAVPHDVAGVGALHEVDGLRDACPLQEDGVQRLSAS